MDVDRTGEYQPLAEIEMPLAPQQLLHGNDTALLHADAN
jgi:hypothetical protein